MRGLNWQVFLISCQCWVARLNPLGVLAWFALSLAAVGWLALVPRWQDQVMQQRQAVAGLREALRQPMVDAPQSVPRSEQNLRRFHDALGDPRHMEQQLKTIFAVAHGVGLNITQAEYKFVCDRVSETCAYRVQLPIKGSYGSIRRFAEQALSSIPFASLDEISFKREAVNDNEPEARLRLSFYVSPPPEGMPTASGDEP
jgi:hypothetical protein